jgi:hypothetical protein
LPVLHFVPQVLPKQVYGEHIIVPAVPQEPPLHVCWKVSVPPWQLGPFPQLEPSAACTQAPLPSHLPVLPQGAAAHCPEGAAPPAVM